MAILWKKSLRASPLKLPETDCLCGLEIHLEDGDRSLYILGVYMPSADQPQDAYSTYLDSTEQVISQLSSKGPLIILGDLNRLTWGVETLKPSTIGAICGIR